MLGEKSKTRGSERKRTKQTASGIENMVAACLQCRLGGQQRYKGCPFWGREMNSVRGLMLEVCGGSCSANGVSKQERHIRGGGRA